MAQSGDLLLKDGVFKHGGANTPGWISNVGITLAAGVLTVTDVSGNPLTANNPGFITVPSTTPGQFVTLKITTSFLFTDGNNGSPDLTNLGFGITEASDWLTDAPFFLGFLNRNNTDADGTDGNSVVCLGRSPCMATSPSSANDIGDTGAIPANDSQNVILIMKDVTVASYTSKPYQVFGSLRMQWASASTVWTVQTLGNSDGVGQTQLEKTFSTEWTYPVGQNGAAASSYLLANGGTPPAFTSSVYKYMLYPNGECKPNLDLSGDPGTDGSGAVNCDLSVPYALASSTANIILGLGQIKSGGSSTLSYYASTGAVANVGLFGYNVSSNNLRDSVSRYQHANFTNGDREIAGPFIYKAFA